MKNNKNSKNDASHIGHRERVKDLFLSTMNINNIYDDRVLLELILFYSVPRKDVKPLVNNLLNTFGSLANLLATDVDNLTNFKPLTKNSVALLQVMQKTFEHILLSRVKQSGNVLNNFGDLIQHASVKIANKPYECLYIVFLNSKYKYLTSKVINVGDIDSVALNTKDIIVKASSIPVKYIAIFHNHPSGDFKPSVKDLQATSELIDLLQTIKIELIDHIILSPQGSYSILNQAELPYINNKKSSL